MKNNMTNITPIAKKIIENNAAAFATVDKTHKPNVIGVSCLKVVSKNQILITDNYMKQTVSNISKNNNVCLAVWNKKQEGYKLIGKAKYYSIGKWKKFVEKMRENKGMPAKGAIVIVVSKIIKMG